MDPVLKRIGDVTIERVAPQKPQHPPPPVPETIEDLDSEGTYSDENLSDEDIIDLDKQDDCVQKSVDQGNIGRDFTFVSDEVHIRQTVPKRKFSDAVTDESDDRCKKVKPDNDIADILDFSRSGTDVGEKVHNAKGELGPEGDEKKINDSADELTDDEYESSDSETERDVADVKKMKGASSTSAAPIDLEKTDFLEKLTQGLPFDGSVLTESNSSDKADPDTPKVDTPESTDVASDYDYDITEKLREMGEISVQPVKKGELIRKANIDEPKSEISVTATKNKHGSDSDTDESEKLGVERKIGNMRRNIREVMDEAQLDEATLAAQRQEMERLRRVQEQQRIIREVQRQIALNRQNQKTQHRVISLLQGNSSIIKQVPGGSTPSSSRVGSTVLVKLPNGETKPMTRLPKGHTPFEMVRVHKASGLQNKCGIPRNLINVKGNLTPSVSIAPVAKKTFIPPPPDGTELIPEIEDKKPPKQKKDVVTISSSSDDDCIILSEDEEPEPEPDEDPCNSGMHTNDAYNIPDEQGRVLVNVGHPENEADVFIAPQIARVIKPHQIGGVRFLFDNVIESIDRFNTSTGFGCILAHSMGLGKTLQVVCFSDIFLRHTSAKTILCIMPINTLQNWMAEFNMWLPTDAGGSPLKTHGEVRPRNFALHVLNDSHKSLSARAKIIQEWNRNGGVLLIGYELYRLLSLKRNSRSKRKKKPTDVVDLEEDDKNKSMFDEIHTALVKPGPDLVICDEGHRIKNSHASISQALKQIRSKRRVVLTGYPLQNNLLEYWCMVDFVRPNYLGTKTEFCNMFERPIQNGQCIDSTPQDIRLMRYRAHVLHSLLEGFVQRRSHVVLQQSLPQKEEYVMLVRMTSFQRKLYDTFMNEVVRTKTVPNPLKAFAVCCKIWNHPDVLYYFLKKREREDAVDIDLEEVAAASATTTPIKKSTANEPGTPKRSRARPRPPPKRDNKKSPKQQPQAESPNAKTSPANKPAASVLPNTSSSNTESTSSNITSDTTSTSYNSNSSDFLLNNQTYPNTPQQQQQPSTPQPPPPNVPFSNTPNLPNTISSNPVVPPSTQPPNAPPPNGPPPHNVPPQTLPPPNLPPPNIPPPNNLPPPSLPPPTLPPSNTPAPPPNTHPSNPQNYGPYPQPTNPEYYNQNAPYPPNNQYNNYYPNPNAPPPGGNYNNNGYFGPNQGNHYNGGNWSNWNNDYSQPYNQGMQQQQDYGRFPNNPYPQNADNTDQPNQNQVPATQNVAGTFENNTSEPSQYDNSQTGAPQPGQNQFNKPPLNSNNTYDQNMYNNETDNSIKREQTNTPYPPNNQPNTNNYYNAVDPNYNAPVKNETDTNFQYNNAMKTEPETQPQNQPYNRPYGNQFDPQNNQIKMEPNMHPQPPMNYFNDPSHPNAVPFNQQNNMKTGNEFANPNYNYNPGEPPPPPYANHNYYDANQYGPPPMMYNQNMYPQQNYNPPPYGPPPPHMSPAVQNCNEFVDPKIEPKYPGSEQIKTEIKTENDIKSTEFTIKNENSQNMDGIKPENFDDKIKNEEMKEECIKDEEGKGEDGKYDGSGIKISSKEDAGIPYDWAVELLKGYVPGCIENSAKMEILFCILSESMALGDRILLFSQSLFTLNLIEEFLQRYEVPGSQDKWARNVNYYRLDGSTSALEREKLINEFNSNPNIHLFMVSTRAGSLGINLVGANRVIVFDASWNPCHDTQAVCRVYRYGQKKPCFVYRLVMDNCLEKKIYDRQINKQGMADRVVDECNPDAHLSMKDVTNLCWDDEKESEIKDFSSTKDKYIDVVMQKVLDAHSHVLSKEPFQHESLLVDRKEKKLSQAEKRQAKRSYELEKKAASNAARTPAYGYHTGMAAGTSIVSMHRRGMMGEGAMHNKPIASVRPMQAELNSQLVRDGQRRSRWIPAEVWQRQGMTAQEMTLPLDVVIPTNGGDRGNIVLKAGQKVLVLKSPKGIYMQLECGKIVAIRTAMKVRGQAANQSGAMKTPANPGMIGPPKSNDEMSPDGSLLKKPNARMPALSTKSIPLPLKNNSAVTIIPKANPQKIVKPFTQVSGYAKLNRQMQNSRNINARIQNIRFANNKPMGGLSPSMHQRQIQLGKAKPFNLSNRNMMDPDMINNSVELKRPPQMNPNEPETHVIDSDEEGPETNMPSGMIKPDRYGRKSMEINDSFPASNMRGTVDMNEGYDTSINFRSNVDHKQNESMLDYCEKPIQRINEMRSENISKEVVLNKISTVSNHFKNSMNSDSMEITKTNVEENFNQAQLNECNESSGMSRDDRYRFMEHTNMRNEYGSGMSEYSNFNRHSDMAVDFSVQQRINPDYNEKSQSGFGRKPEFPSDFSNAGNISHHDIHPNSKRFSNPYYKEKQIHKTDQNIELLQRTETSSDTQSSTISLDGDGKLDSRPSSRPDFNLQNVDMRSDLKEKDKFDSRNICPKPQNETILDIPQKTALKRAGNGLEILEVKSLDKSELIDVEMVTKSFENVHEGNIIKTDLTKSMRPGTPKANLKNYRHNFSSQKAPVHQQRVPMIAKNQSALHRLEQTTSAIGNQSENSGPSLQKSLDNITSDGAIPSHDSTIKSGDVKLLPGIEISKKTQSVLPLKDDVQKEPPKSKNQNTPKPTKLNLKEIAPQTIVLDSDNESPTKSDFTENQQQPQNYNRVENNAYEYPPYGAPPMNTGYYGGYNQMQPHPPYGTSGSQPYYNPENIGNQYNAVDNSNAPKTLTQPKPNNPATSTDTNTPATKTESTTTTTQNSEAPATTNNDYQQDKNAPNVTPGFGHHFPGQQPMMPPGPPLQQGMVAGYGHQQGQYPPPNYPAMPYPPTSTYQPPYQPPPYDQNYTAPPYSAFHRPDMLPYPPPPAEGYGPPPPGPPFAPMRQGFHPPQYPPYPQAPPPHQPMYPAYNDPAYSQYNPNAPPGGFNQYANHSYAGGLPNVNSNPNPPPAP